MAGEWSFPREDCGGIPGDERCVEAAGTGIDPWGEGDAEFLEWLRDWRPEKFDLEQAQKHFLVAPTVTDDADP